MQLHWHWLFKKTPLTWDICTNLRTCSVKRPCIDRIYNVRVVLLVHPTPQRGKGMGKERGSQEGENLRDRDRGSSPSPWSLWLSPSFILTGVPTRIANPRSAVRQKELSVACYHRQILKVITEVHQIQDFLYQPRCRKNGTSILNIYRLRPL